MYQLSVPSKTFLIGEYVALEGGPALLLNTEPRFQLKVVSKDEAAHGTSLRASSSPQVQEVLAQTFFQEFDFYFSDPFEGRGGLGASSAMLGMLLAFHQWKCSGNFNVYEILKECEQLAGFTGSGYDVMAQLTGNVCVLEKQTQTCQEVQWPWPDLEVVLLRGPQKTLTHEHLAFVGTDFPDLKKISQEAVTAFKKSQLQPFLEALQRFSEVQKNLRLLSLSTYTQLEHFKNDPVVRIARGCGAMGSDILLLIVEKKRNQSWDINLKKSFEVLPMLLSRGLRISQARDTSRDKQKSVEL